MNRYLELNKINCNVDDINKVGHRGTGGEQGGLYGVYGLAPCIPASCYKDPLKVVYYERRDKDNSSRNVI